MIPFGVGVEQFAKALMPPHMRHDGAAVIFGQIAPYQRHILAPDGVIEELFGNSAPDCPLRFGQHHQTAGILIYPVYQSETGKGLFGNGSVHSLPADARPRR